MFRKFYESIHYEPISDRLVRRGGLGGNITFSDRDPAARDRILSYFDELSPEHIGVLHGEYLLLGNGLGLIDRKGVLLLGAVPMHNPATGFACWQELQKPEFLSVIAEFYAAWEDLPLAHNMPVIADYFAENYYHFSMELVPRLRHFIGHGCGPCIIPHTCIRMTFQRDLLGRIMRGRPALPLENPIRVFDPILIQDRISAEGIYWLRRVTGLSAQAGRRRVYIRRASRGTRSTGRGGLSETPAFLMLLRDFGFETIDFGEGERSVAEQVAMLDGAGLILAPHGAALTNLAYVSPQVQVIEAIGKSTQGGEILHIASAVRFEYHGLYSRFADTMGDIALDADELRDAVRERVALMK